MSVLLGAAQHANELRLETRTRKQIPNRMAPPHLPTLQRGFDVKMRKEHPTARLRSLGGGPHNCVGMVFASRRTSIEPEQIPVILGEDGYRQIPEAEVMIGDVVVYGRVAHVGVVACREELLQGLKSPSRLMVLSKWGEWGEYLHELHDVPPTFYPDDIEFWTERMP